MLLSPFVNNMHRGHFHEKMSKYGTTNSPYSTIHTSASRSCKCSCGITPSPQWSTPVRIEGSNTNKVPGSQGLLSSSLLCYIKLGFQEFKLEWERLTDKQSPRHCGQRLDGNVCLVTWDSSMDQFFSFKCRFQQLISSKDSASCFLHNVQRDIRFPQSCIDSWKLLWRKTGQVYETRVQTDCFRDKGCSIYVHPCFIDEIMSLTSVFSIIRKALFENWFPVSYGIDFKVQRAGSVLYQQ